MKKKIASKRVILITALLSLTVFTTGCNSKTNTSETSVSTEKTEAATTAETQAASESLPSEEETQADENVITGFEDINTDKVNLIALGNSDVPVGQYSEEILTNLGIWENIQSKISFGTNVKEVLSQVSEGSVDCGIVYATDAATEDGVSVICKAPENSLATPVVYPAAMLKSTANADAAKLFLNFLLTDGARAEFEKVGFKFYSDTAPSNIDFDGECTITVFAAASLTESLTAISDLFKAEYPNIEVVLNFDSSGTLQTQIESGSEADLFISAAQKQMKVLTDGDYIDETTKIDLLENEVVLIVPKE